MGCALESQRGGPTDKFQRPQATEDNQIAKFKHNQDEHEIGVTVMTPTAATRMATKTKQLPCNSLGQHLLAQGVSDLKSRFFLLTYDLEKDYLPPLPPPSTRLLGVPSRPINRLKQCYFISFTQIPLSLDEFGESILNR